MAAPLVYEVVGRDEEVAGVRRLLDHVVSGQPGTLVIEGEAGIGKTRLVGSLIDDARAAGAVVWSGSSHPFERTRPFGPLVDALDLRPGSLDPERAKIGRLLASAADTSVAVSGAVPDVRFRVVDEILGVVEASCAERPSILVLEDLHWADNSTLLAVRSLVRGAVHLPFLVVASFRPAPRSAELDLLLDDVIVAGADSIRLRPLLADDVTALVRREFDAAPGPDLGMLLAKAAGNPLWVVEILRSLSDEGLLHRDGNRVEASSTEWPDSLRELVMRRLRYLSEPTLALLQLTAVLGDTASIHDIAVTAGRPAGEIAAQLGEAYRAGLLDERTERVAFRHQLVHDAIYQSVPAPVRRVMHRDAATALAAAGADPLQVADHLVLGAVRGDLEAVERLRVAAREAAAGAPATCVELLQRAESLLPGRHPDADLLSAELVEALLRAGKVADAAARAEAVLGRRHRDDVDVPMRLSLISALSIQNRPTELIQRTEATLVEVPNLPLVDQSLVLAQASFGRTFSGDLVGGEGMARRALEIAERAGDAATTVWSLTTLSVAVKWQGRYPEALELAQRAVELASDPLQPAARLRHPKFFLGMVLCDADQFEEADAAFAEALDEYDELGSMWLVSDTLLMSATTRFLTGVWDDAEAGLNAGLSSAQEQGNLILVAPSRAYQVMMAIGRGDHQAARVALALVDQSLRELSPGFGVETVAFAASMLAEAEGDDAGAYDLLSRFWELDEQHSNRYYHRWLAPPLVRLALEFGRRDIAERVTATVESDTELPADVATVRAAGLRCRGLLENDADRMIEAVAHARRSARLLDHAGACEDAARVLVSAGRSDEAKELLTEALTRYDDAGADAWAARVTATLRELGVRRGVRGPRGRPTSGWASLTDTQRAVSLLVAEGLTNREVAKRLHVSPHTVNTHLRHVFEKLSVVNRAALAGAVARFDDHRA